MLGVSFSHVVAVVLLWFTAIQMNVVSGFSPLSSQRHMSAAAAAAGSWGSLSTAPFTPTATRLFLMESDSDIDDDEDKDKPKVNPYADPNYPDLEFVDYSDPEYRVDMGLGEDFFDEQVTDDEIELEAMREERRRRNDEYQFQTYFHTALKKGTEFKGEWTVYQTSTFVDTTPQSPDDNAMPRLLKVAKPLHVASQGSKLFLEDDDDEIEALFPIDRERILHVERLFTEEQMNGGVITSTTTTLSSSDDHSIEHQQIMARTYWPETLQAKDFRGPQGIMIVGNAYTVATAVPLESTTTSTTTTTDNTSGPFREYRAEVGLTTNQLRFRIKLDYAILDSDTNSNPPPLHLRSLIVCREMHGSEDVVWPQSQKFRLDDPVVASINEALFGVPGADNGLYDPPPVGNEQQAMQYLQLDLDGHATTLFPYKLDQTPAPKGWVISLDWTPGALRYQVDRKVNGGADLLGLKTLELSEVQSSNAETYRPRDGGQDMRQ